LGRLSTLILPHNYIGGDFPQFVLDLPYLQTLDMSDNKLQSLPPPSKWKTKSLLALLLANNAISEVRSCVSLFEYG
jgi:Leucine-rich repeat (LRR) protein